MIVKARQNLPFIAHLKVHPAQAVKNAPVLARQNQVGIAAHDLQNQMLLRGAAHFIGAIERSLVADMPIGAFQAVRQGQTSTALVPSLYALRADGRETFLRVPQEGPVLIPSYLCARASAPEWAARRVAERILSRELCDFYAANGDLIVYPACTGRRSGQEADYALCPSAAWLEHLSHVDFYRLYCTKLPSAIEFAYA